MKTETTTVSTQNKNLDQAIEVEIEITVPENVEEAVEFYGSEEKLIQSVQADVSRRKCNAARPILRDSETELDWAAVAQAAAEDYKPGRKGGFGRVTVSREEAEEALASGDLDALMALLASKGAGITV